MISKNDGKPDRRAIPRSVSDRFGESRTEITISGQLFPKSDGNSQFPDRFGKSCPAIGKVGGNSKKLSSILKSRTETGNSRRKFTISRPHFVFPSGFCQSCPEFEKVSRLSKKSGNFGKSQTEILISRRKSKFPGDFRNFRPAFSISV